MVDVYQNLRKTRIRLESTHYYYGDSVGKLLLHKLAVFLKYLREDRPNAEHLRELKSRRNSMRGKEALVLGNGPSLQMLNENVAMSGKYDIFVVNSFNKMSTSEKLIPDYYVLSDPESFREQSLKSLIPYLVNNEIQLCAPVKYGSSLKLDFEGMLLFDDREKRLFSRNTDPTKPRAYISVTLYKALAIAEYLGYEKIFILGLDNSEFATYRGDIHNRITNFGNYTQFSGNQNFTPFSMKDILVSGIAGRMFSYGRLFADLSFFNRGRIFNLNQHSLVDVFQKIEFHELLKLTPEN